MSESRKRGAPRGSGLYWDARRGLYYWRKTNPVTGKRVPRCTHQKRLDLAMRVAARFDDELRQELAGVKSFASWRVELAPLVERWIRAQEGNALPRGLEAKRRNLLRAMEALRVRVAADLTDLPALDDRLRALEGTRTPGGREITRNMLRRLYQQPLRELSAWLAGNGRYLERDPLLAWEPLPMRRRDQDEEQARRAFLPREVAKALLALDVLDQERGAEVRQRALFVTLLVTAPRATALTERDACHLDAATSRIDFGQGVGNKRRGAGALDAATLEELLAHLGGRRSGPLFLARSGTRYDPWRMADVWREAFGLGLLEDLWPAAEPWSLPLALLVLRALQRGRVSVSRGGNPKLVGAEVRAREAELAGRVAALLERVRGDWLDRMAGVDVHAFRKTHRSWAELLGGVPPAVIDQQLGHAGAAAERSLAELRILAGSVTGRKHYLDRRSPLLDPRRSAEAVRAALDQAHAELLAEGRCRIMPASPQADQA